MDGRSRAVACVPSSPRPIERAKNGWATRRDASLSARFIHSFILENHRGTRSPIQHEIDDAGNARPWAIQ